MISRRSITWLIVVAIVPLSTADAQVRKLGSVPTEHSEVQPASHGCGGCNDCGGGFHRGHFHRGHYGGVVWGNQCMDCCTKHPLFPPCPNPCRTTLAGELVLGVKHAVDSGLENLFHCVFDCHHCQSHGFSSCQCDDGYEIHEGEEAAEVEEQPQPAPEHSDESDPFKDDPPSKVDGTKATMRSVMPGPRVSGPANLRRSVRPVNHQTESQQRVKTRSASRRQPTSASRRIKARTTSTGRSLQAVRTASKTASKAASKAAPKTAPKTASKDLSRSTLRKSSTSKKKVERRPLNQLRPQGDSESMIRFRD